MRSRRVFPVLWGLVLGLAAGSRSADAAWSRNPDVNLAVCIAPGYQESPAAVSDGSGGAIVVWQDHRNGPGDIYAQHVLASGTSDPTWPPAGRALCTASGDQFAPVLVSDGSGGAIVVWNDRRQEQPFSVLFAQHIESSGAVDSDWPVDGLMLCNAPWYQVLPAVVSDGGGGAIVAWMDFRLGGPFVCAQHVRASGTTDEAWPTYGRLLCIAPGGQGVPNLVSDGAGGAIVAWHDGRNGNPDIYAQHVLASGQLDGAWPSNGRGVCNAVSDQLAPHIVSDGAGGGIVVWRDYRNYHVAGGGRDIYAQHVLISGAVDPAWPADGRGICVVPGDQWDHGIAADGSGGAIVSWRDGRNGNEDIFAQHVLASGALDGAWPEGGLAVCTDDSLQWNPNIVSDGAGGAIIAWQDARSDSTDIYSQRVLASGTVDSDWPVNGRGLCTASGSQWYPTIMADGADGVIVAWRDGRNGDHDIYAQRVAASGHLGDPSTGGPRPRGRTSHADVRGAPGVPVRLALSRPSPNPASSFFTVRFALPLEAPVRLALYDATGRRLRTLVDGVRPAGEHTVSSDLRDDAGHDVPAGVYFVRLEAGSLTRVHKVVREP